MILMLHIHYTRAPDIMIADQLTTNPPVPSNQLSRWLRELVQPARRATLGRYRISRRGHVA